MGNGNRPTPEFRREAVRLALTSGRTRREIAEDLGIGLSTLTRWLSHERDASEPSEAPVDVHAELKRLRRENAGLKQERDIQKKSRGLLRERGMWRVNAIGSREPATDDLRLHRGGEGQLPDQPDVPCPGRQPERLLCVAGPSGLSSPAAGHGLSRAYPHRPRHVERHLRQPAHAPRPCRRGP
jgi:transposase